MKKKRNLSQEIDFEGSLKSSYNALDVSIEKVKDMVNEQIDSASTERMLRTMKSKKKIVLIAAAVTLVIGITVFAASGIISQWFSSSSSIPDYKTLPTAEQVEKDIGYEAALMDEFKNGYKFDNGSIVNNSLKDENGNTAEKFKSVTFRYEKDGDKVIFSQDKFNSTVEASAIAFNKASFKLLLNNALIKTHRNRRKYKCYRLFRQAIIQKTMKYRSFIGCI